MKLFLTLIFITQIISSTIYSQTSTTYVRFLERPPFIDCTAEKELSRYNFGKFIFIEKSDENTANHFCIPFCECLLAGNSKSFVNTHQNVNGAADWIATLSIVWPFNPMLVIEDKKAYFAFTKEISLILPMISLKSSGLLTRITAEYSYIFRQERKNHFRLSLETAYPLSTSDFSAVLLSGGVGYFNDTKANGISAQTSLGIFVVITEAVGINLYIKARGTHVFPKERTNIFDLSMGAGLSFYPF